MSSQVTQKSNQITSRSISLNIPISSRTNQQHDLRYSLFAGSRTNEDRPPSGNGIAGILYKWVNYGQGWKRRWFVLHDGVLSYYRIHGSNKISLSVEIERRSKLIGGESLRFICRHSKRGDVHSNGKPLGQIHLKVSSIGQSISESKRFTIFTGTKSLHLRAATSEDQKAWIEALKAVKETFPGMSNEELMASTTNVSISTDKLRQRLMKEEVNETLIIDCEDIMKNNFIALHNEVSSIGQSISESKRFSIFTGTKSLHLRAATSEDQKAWIEALKAVKETFPGMSNEELMASTTNVSISTDKLRQRLMKEEVNETLIIDCEDIMKNNFIALHNEVMTLKQYQYHLIDSLKNI